MIKRKIRGVVFDMDGCLIDTESAYKVAWRKAFDKFAVEISKEKINSWVGLGWDIVEKQIDEITKNHNLTSSIRAAREAYFFQMLEAGTIKFMPGAKELLDYVRRQQLVVGLATSTFESKARKILKHFDLHSCFDFIVFGDEVAHRKPAPDIYLRAIQKSGLTTEKLVAFEDSIVGCKSASDSGLNVIWVIEVGTSTKDSEKPEKVIQIIKSLADGKQILDRM